MSEEFPGWALRELDLHITEEDEIIAAIDAACDDDESFVFVDSDSFEADRPCLAVLLPYDRYTALLVRAHGQDVSE